MIIIGIDPHPATLTAALLDASSARVLGTLEVNNSEEGHQLLRHWVHQHSEDDLERRWAVEGASNPFCAPLVAELLSHALPRRARNRHTTFPHQPVPLQAWEQEKRRG